MHSAALGYRRGRAMERIRAAAETLTQNRPELRELVERMAVTHRDKAIQEVWRREAVADFLEGLAAPSAPADDSKPRKGRKPKPADTSPADSADENITMAAEGADGSTLDAVLVDPAELGDGPAVVTPLPPPVVGDEAKEG